MFFSEMRLFCAGVVRLALCSLFVAAINLDGCLRGALVIQRANSNPPLRKAIKEAFNFSVVSFTRALRYSKKIIPCYSVQGANGTIAGVLVLSKDRQASVYAALAGRRKVWLISLKHCKFKLGKGFRQASSKA